MYMIDKESKKKASENTSRKEGLFKCLEAGSEINIKS
jgi:hypothetical protein